jgi:tRNA (cmo5U34)-methyltransferase
MGHFSDPSSVARYAEGPRRLVPGLEALHRMTLLLLAERAPKEARVLVLGAGGGMELKVFAEGQPGWRFDGVDPSAAMLKLAEEALGPLAAQVSLHEGYIESAPDGPFDAATCLLTLHFLGMEERLRTLQEVRRRMKPGAPFVVAHHSFPRDEPGRELWSSRFAAFAVASGVDRGMMETGRGFIAHKLPALSPDEDEASLRAAGFSDVSLFYAAFSFRGWVAYA